MTDCSSGFFLDLIKMEHGVPCNIELNSTVSVHHLVSHLDPNRFFYYSSKPVFFKFCPSIAWCGLCSPLHVWRLHFFCLHVIPLFYVQRFLQLNFFLSLQCIWLHSHKVYNILFPVYDLVVADLWHGLVSS